MRVRSLSGSEVVEPPELVIFSSRKTLVVTPAPLGRKLLTKFFLDYTVSISKLEKSVRWNKLLVAPLINLHMVGRGAGLQECAEFSQGQRSKGLTVDVYFENTMAR
jgi:hypothetical protein